MEFQYIVEHWVEAIVGVVISIVIGIWVISMFVDLSGVTDFVKGLFGKERTVLKCTSCGHKNPENAKYCSGCGEEL